MENKTIASLEKKRLSGSVFLFMSLMTVLSLALGFGAGLAYGVSL